MIKVKVLTVSLGKRVLFPTFSCYYRDTKLGTLAVVDRGFNKVCYVTAMGLLTQPMMHLHLKLRKGKIHFKTEEPVDLISLEVSNFRDKEMSQIYWLLPMGDQSLISKLLISMDRWPLTYTKGSDLRRIYDGTEQKVRDTWGISLHEHFGNS